MAHSKQAKNRIRTNEKRRLRNKATTSSMRSSLKKLEGLVEAGNKAEAQAELPSTLSRIDKAAKSNVIHAKAAARPVMAMGLEAGSLLESSAKSSERAGPDVIPIFPLSRLSSCRVEFFRKYFE